MNQTSEERFYQLLPALYRRRDIENGEALRALFMVLEYEFNTLEADMSATYNNWFIQTCDAWVIPYLADLVGVRGFSQAKYLFPTQRRQVANAIGYRRRKGTLPALEHVLRDVTSWIVRVVEYSESLGYTEKIGHSTFNPSRSVNLRSADILSDLDDSSGRVAHTLNLHNVSQSNQPSPYKYGLDGIGIYIWRLRSYLVKNSPICPIRKTADDNPLIYTVDPLGRDMPLFNFPQMVSKIDQKTESVNIPFQLTKQLLAVDIENYETSSRSDANKPQNSLYYGQNCGLCVMTSDGNVITPDEIVSMNLSQWTETDQAEADKRFKSGGKRIGIDVDLGRIVILDASLSSQNIKVNYCYGFGGEIGGGPYNRKNTLRRSEQYGFSVDVAQSLNADSKPQVDSDEGLLDTLETALTRWEAYCKKTTNPTGIIHILDNGVYSEKLVVNMPPGSQLSIVADNGVRPTLSPIEKITVNCTEAQTIDALSAEGITRQLRLDGLFIDGALEVTGSTAKDLLNLTFQHCTLMPHGIEIASLTQENWITVKIDHSIVGPLHLSSAVKALDVSDAIIDYGSGYAIAGDSEGSQPLSNAVLKRVTIFGKVAVQRIQACDVLFRDPITSPQPNSSDYDVQSCYVPDGSLKSPQFTSTRFGDPGYAQLSDFCPVEILTGGTEEAEIGVFHDTYRVQAQMNIQSALDEFMPLGITAGIFYLT